MDTTINEPDIIWSLSIVCSFSWELNLSRAGNVISLAGESETGELLIFSLEFEFFKSSLIESRLI